MPTLVYDNGVANVFIGPDVWWGGRPDDVALKGPLFGPGGPKPEDVRQGELGDCFLLAALMSFAKAHPEAIRKMIRQEKDGTFTVTFREPARTQYALDANGNLVEVTVPAKTVDVNVTAAVPADRSGKPMYEQGDGGTWPAIVEKAYAQQYGGGKGYEGLDGGYATEAMKRLTGVASERNSLAPINVGGGTTLPFGQAVTFEGMRSAQAAGGMMVVTRDGLENHAFSVQNLFVGADGRQMVELLNPHNGDAGSSSFEGRFVVPFDELVTKWNELDLVRP